MKYRIVNEAVKSRMLDSLAGIHPSKTSPMVVTVKEDSRNLDQNAMLWSLLDAFSSQVKWPVNGAMIYMTPEDWKDVLSAAFKKETLRIAQGFDGSLVMLGLRTSKMTKREFSDFLEFILAAGAYRGVEFDERMVA